MVAAAAAAAAAAAIWLCHMALPYGFAIWLCHMALPYGLAIWPCHIARFDEQQSRFFLQSKFNLRAYARKLNFVKAPSLALLYRVQPETLSGAPNPKKNMKSCQHELQKKKITFEVIPRVSF